MQFSIVIDQVKAIEWGLSVSECAVLDFITKAASWAQTKEKDGLTFYWVTFGKLKEDLPLVATSEQTTRRIIRRLEQTGLILAENFGNMATYRLTDKGKQWNTNQPAKVEVQPTKLAGRKKEGATKLEGQACQSGRVEPANLEGPSIRVLDTSELELKQSQVLVIEEDPVDKHFESFWSNYPRKIGKGQAKKAFRSALKRENIKEIAAGFGSFLESCKGKDSQYIPHAATWLNGDRWTDDYQQERKAPVNFGID